MANWVGSYKMQLKEGKGPEVAELLRQAKKLNMPGNVRYEIAIKGDTIFGYEEWETQQHHKDSLEIPEVKALISQAFPHMDGMPEMVFEGEAI